MGKGLGKETFFLFGKEISSFPLTFKRTNHQGVNFSCFQTKERLTLCYALFSNYFILAPSEESMEKVIEELIKLIKGELRPIPLVIIEKFLTKGHHSPITDRTIDTIIIHSTYNALGGDPYDPEKVIEKYEMDKVATHYLIARDGKIYHLVPEQNIAYHAEPRQMPDGRKNINSFSIGIELIYTLLEGPNDVQYFSLIQLINHLRQKYDIHSKNILGHKDVAQDKTDPWKFDWNIFSHF